MKIIFILGKYNPSRCGISDYVDLLSKELIKNGHIVGIRSFDSLRELRQLARDLEEADLYSIQFAPYAFSKIGFAGNALRLLAKSLEAKSVQVTFHELWIGSYPGSPVKHTVIGWVQKYEILTFLKVTKPSLIYATNSAALHRLRKAGISAAYLYLFGNIPFSQSQISSDQSILKIGFFGTLYDSFPYDLLGERLKSIYRLTKRKIILLRIGRTRESQGLIKLKRMAESRGFDLFETGELSAPEVSKEIQSCSLGISTTPYDVMGKSGATAALLEHRLPILTHDDGDTPQKHLIISKLFDDQIFQLDDVDSPGEIAKYITQPKRKFINGVAYTAEEVLESLELASRS